MRQHLHFGLVGGLFLAIASAQAAPKVGGEPLIGNQKTSEAKRYDRCSLAGVWVRNNSTYWITVDGREYQVEYSGVSAGGLPVRGESAGTISEDGRKASGTYIARGVPGLGSVTGSESWTLRESGRHAHHNASFALNPVTFFDPGTTMIKIAPGPCR